MDDKPLFAEGLMDRYANIIAEGSYSMSEMESRFGDDHEKLNDIGSAVVYSLPSPNSVAIVVSRFRVDTKHGEIIDLCWRLVEVDPDEKPTGREWVDEYDFEQWIYETYEVPNRERAEV